jgi:nitronate monooxygenase
MEAGGHRGCFDAAKAEAEMVGLFALVPAVVDAARIPVVATGGIADARGVAAALTLGASAAQVGTASFAVRRHSLRRPGRTPSGAPCPKGRW